MRLLDTIDKSKFIALCIGNISEHKNQKMLVDAYMILDENIKNKLLMIFIGNNAEELSGYAAKNNLNGVLFTGVIPKQEVYEYLKVADLCLMASLEEGFGMPIVEGYSFGVPAILPETVDAFPDLYEPNACIPVKEYTAVAFAEAIKQAFVKQWDKNAIKKFALKFDINNCAKEYLKVLKQAKVKGTSKLTETEIKKILNLCS